MKRGCVEAAEILAWKSRWRLERGNPSPRDQGYGYRLSLQPYCAQQVLTAEPGKLVTFDVVGQIEIVCIPISIPISVEEYIN